MESEPVCGGAQRRAGHADLGEGTERCAVRLASKALVL